MNRRDFLQVLMASVVAPGCAPRRLSEAPGRLYDVPSFGNATLLHFTDCHAQLLPLYYREPAVNTGVGAGKNRPPHLTGQAFLDFFAIKSKSPEAYALSSLDFAEAAEVYGTTGGFAHLATLIARLRDERGEGNVLLLDGGDSWQGSATALWTQGRDMVEACNQLGVDVMTGHWEFTYGDGQVLANLAQFAGDFVAQNVALTEEAQFERDADSDRIFKPYLIKQLTHARLAVIGQAFPYTPIANPKRFVPDWQFGIQEQNLQRNIDQIKADKAADVIVLLSHNGMEVDLKLASRVSGLDIILGGHTHDAMPRPVPVTNAGGRTWVTNAGSHGKFLAVLDMDVRQGRLLDLNYRLLPVFSELLEPDAKMQQLIAGIRAPYLDKLNQPLTVAEALLYRRDTFQGTFDRLILEALLDVNDAEIALSPGFRWGPSFLPGQTLKMEDLMSHTAITYPETYVRTLAGREIKTFLEDVADNLFNKDPYYRQGGDMVRVGGLCYVCVPEAEMGRRIAGLTLANGQSVHADKHYKVSGWAAVGEPLPGKPVWEVVAEFLKGR